MQYDVITRRVYTMHFYKLVLHGQAYKINIAYLTCLWYGYSPSKYFMEHSYHYQYHLIHSYESANESKIWMSGKMSSYYNSGSKYCGFVVATTYNILLFSNWLYRYKWKSGNHYYVWQSDIWQVFVCLLP